MAEVQDQRYYVSLVVSQQENASFLAVVVLDVSELEASGEDRITINMEVRRDDIAQKGKVVLDGVYFDFDKATLTSESKEALYVTANYLKANGEQQCYVVGHIDGKGD